MTREEFQARFRGRMLVFLMEAWAARKENPSALGQLMDAHALQLKGLLGEMYDALAPVTKATSNGQTQTPLPQVRR